MCHNIYFISYLEWGFLSHCLLVNNNKKMYKKKTPVSSQRVVHSPTPRIYAYILYEKKKIKQYNPP